MIEFLNVSKAYRRRDGGETVILNEASFIFEASRGVGILGRNGAGKSTILRLIAGSERPDTGTIIRKCRVSWPIGFGGGLHARMTGRENARFIARIYGEDPALMVKRAADFADIGVHLDMPISSYSSGMKARLAFGISLAIDFECYLIDEVIAVGDAAFKARCEKALNEKLSRAFVILISHDENQIKKFCDRKAAVEDHKLVYLEPSACLEKSAVVSGSGTSPSPGALVSPDCTMATLPKIGLPQKLASLFKLTGRAQLVSPHPAASSRS